MKRKTIEDLYDLNIKYMYYDPDDEDEEWFDYDEVIIE